MLDRLHGHTEGQSEIVCGWHRGPAMHQAGIRGRAGGSLERQLNELGDTGLETAGGNSVGP